MFISKATHVFAMDKANTPVAEAPAHGRMTFETLDCFSEQVQCEKDTLDTVDFDRVNPATGPVFIPQIKAGETLAVHISAIRVKSPGKMLAAPELGVLGSRVSESEIKMIPIEGDQLIFSDRLTLPLRPMIGVIGVAPAGEPVNCGTPGAHGGNMDTTLIRPDSTVYFPVQVDGALLAMGDLHAAMGDGEIMVSGVEVSGEVDITATKAQGLAIKTPLVKTEEALAFIASHEEVEGAIELATSCMADLLMEKAGMSLNEAGMLMSACGDVEISQVVDPEKTARMAMPRDVLRTLGIDLAF